MLLTRDFVFLHVPKTGGTFVRRVLLDHAPAPWEVVEARDHATVREIPASYAHLPRLTFVRNPFSWYVSWYHFHLTRAERQPFFDDISDHGHLDFAATMRRALRPGGVFGDTAGPFLQALIEQLGEGLVGIRCGKVEFARSELVRLFRECVEVPESLRLAIERMPVVNPSAHRPWREYYDDELRRMVEEKDAPIFDHFGYGFDHPDGP